MSVLDFLKYCCLVKKFSKIDIISYGMILGGVYGNLIDRIIHRSVTDYLSFNIFGYDFPVFNMADTFITIGVVLLFIALNRKDKNYDSK